jgi:DNA sulfur modification protein DndE
MIIETVRISKRGRDQLIKLKRKTGIENWNIICRWALCVSLTEATTPMNYDSSEMSNIEMTWRTFGGKNADIYEALIQLQASSDMQDPTPEMVSQFFRNHLHRGIAALSTGKRITHIGDLVNMAQSEVH